MSCVHAAQMRCWRLRWTVGMANQHPCLHAIFALSLVVPYADAAAAIQALLACQHESSSADATDVTSAAAVQGRCAGQHACRAARMAALAEMQDVAAAAASRGSLDGDRAHLPADVAIASAAATCDCVTV
jgi:hypothetical protein